MNEELLDLLREIADPNVCTLPEWWRAYAGGKGSYFARDGAAPVKEWLLGVASQPDHVMDLLGRLSRAIEGEGHRVFERASDTGTGHWQVCDNDYVAIGSEYFRYGDVASEAVALAKCIRAACAVEVAA
jgi:hypothetical protein